MQTRIETVVRLTQRLLRSTLAEHGLALKPTVEVSSPNYIGALDSRGGYPALSAPPLNCIEALVKRLGYLLGCQKIIIEIGSSLFHDAHVVTLLTASIGC